MSVIYSSLRTSDVRFVLELEVPQRTRAISVEGMAGDWGLLAQREDFRGRHIDVVSWSVAVAQRTLDSLLC